MHVFGFLKNNFSLANCPNFGPSWASWAPFWARCLEPIVKDRPLTTCLFCHPFANLGFLDSLLGEMFGANCRGQASNYLLILLSFWPPGLPRLPGVAGCLAGWLARWLAGWLAD